MPSSINTRLPLAFAANKHPSLPVVVVVAVAVVAVVVVATSSYSTMTAYCLRDCVEKQDFRWAGHGRGCFDLALREGFGCGHDVPGTGVG